MIWDESHIQKDAPREVVVIPTATEVFGRNLDIIECESVLSTINRESAIHVLCLLKNINERVFRTKLSRESTEYLVPLKYLLKFLLDKEHGVRVLEIFLEHKEDFLPFSDQALAATLVFACKSSNKISGSTLQSVEERMRFIEVVFSFQGNTLSEQFVAQIEQNPVVTETIFADFFRNTIAHLIEDNYRYSIARLFAILSFDRIHVLFREKSGFDFSSWALDRLGISPDRLMQCASLMGTIGFQLNPEKPNVEHLYFNPDQHFGKLLNDLPDLNDLIEIASATPEDFADTIREKDNLSEFLYASNFPLVWPIVKLDSNRICFSQNQLINKFVFGLPYLLQELHQYKKRKRLNDEEVKRIRGDCGNLFEAYVQWLFEGWFSDCEEVQLFFNEKWQHGPRNGEIDVALIHGRVTYIFEVKSILPTLAVRQTGSASQIIEVMAQSVDQAYQGANYVYERSQKREFAGVQNMARVIPCVVTYGNFPVAPPLANRFEELLSKKIGNNAFKTGGDISPVQFFSISAFESAERYFDFKRSSVDFLHLLQKRATDQKARYEGLQNALGTERNDISDRPGLLDRTASEALSYLNEKILPLLRKSQETDQILDQ